MRSRRAFYILVGVTIVMVVAAFVSQRPADDPEPSYGLHFPGLGDEVDEVRAVKVTTAGRSLRLARSDGGWLARSKNDYPADAERVRQLVLGLSRLRRLEKKTSNPERFSSLELSGVDQENSKAVRVTLFSEDDAELASVLVGKTRDFQASGRSRYFIRTAGDPQTWLVEGSLPPVLEDVSSWLQQELLPGIKKADIRTLTVTHADGETVEIRAAGDKGAGFRLTELAQDEKVRNQRSIDAMADTFQRLALKNVLDAAATEPGNAVATVEAATYGGVRITARFNRRDPDYGARLQARYDPEQDRTDGGGKGDGGRGGRQLARDLNARWEGRVFVVSQYALDALLARPSELIEGPDSSAEG